MKNNLVRRIAGIALCAALPFIFVLIGSVRPLDAQNVFGSLVGNVIDSSQAPVPGSPVSILDQGTGLTRTASTNDRGEYSFPNLPAGIYRVSASKAGFKEAVKSEVPVTFDAISRADLVLEVGVMSDKIEVTAEAQEIAVKTDRADTGGVVTHEDITELPNPMGTYEQMLVLVPGVSGLSCCTASTDNSASTPATYSVNGNSGPGRTTTIDGAVAINLYMNGTAAYVPSTEAVQEVVVTSSSFDAGAAGAGGGGTVALTIKSGTNTLHGSLYYTHSDGSLMDNPANFAQGFQKPHLVFNQPGATLGGPVLKNKLFYFVSDEFKTWRQSTGAFYTVPSAAMRAGDESADPNLIYNPYTGTSDGKGRTPFPNDQIPQSMFNPIMAEIFPMYPLPNVANAGITNNFFSAPVTNTNTNIGDAKINYNPTSKLTTFARLGIVNANSYTGSIFPQIGSAKESGISRAITYSTSFAATYTATPHLVLDATFGWTEVNTNVLQQGEGTNYGQKYGIPNTNGPAEYQSGWPEFQLDTFPTFGTAQEYLPWHRSEPQYTYVSNGSWMKGAHLIKFGGYYDQQNLNHIQAEYDGGANAFGAQGGFGFSGTLTTLNGGPSTNEYNSMASILMGLVSSLGQNTMPQGILTLRQALYAGYVQDQWQASRKLTVNLGLRWEYTPLMTRGAVNDGGIDVYEFATNTVEICGYEGVSKTCGINIPKFSDNFGPRAGLAYRLAPNFVVRAGYSIGYDPTYMRALKGSYPAMITMYESSGANTPSTYVPIETLSQGLPATVIPVVVNGSVPLPSSNNLTSIVPGYKRGYVQSWNLTLEKQLAHSTTASVGYVANRVNGMMTLMDYNGGNIGCANACQPLNIQWGRTGAEPIYSTIGNMHYDSVQATIRRRTRDYMVAVNFTYDRQLGQQAGWGGKDTAGADGPLYYGPTTSPQLYVVSSFNAGSPFGKGKALFANNRLASAILGNWNLGGIYTITGGNRFGCTGGGNLNDVNGPTQVCNWAPGMTSAQTLGGIGTTAAYFNPLDFVAAPAGVLGNTSQNFLTGPTIYNLDSSLIRKFQLTEKIRTELRIECFNVTNTPQWAAPAMNISNLQLNSNGTVKNLNGFDTITTERSAGRSVGEERQFQFEFRAQF